MAILVFRRPPLPRRLLQCEERRVEDNSAQLIARSEYTGCELLDQEVMQCPGALAVYLRPDHWFDQLFV